MLDPDSVLSREQLSIIVSASDVGLRSQPKVVPLFR